MTDQLQDKEVVLLDVRQEDQFQDDSRDVQAALIYARRFASQDPSAPFAHEQEAKDAADAIRGLKIVRDAAVDHRKEIARQYWQTAAAVKAEYDELLAQPLAAIDALTKRALATKRQLEERHREEARRRREELQRSEEAAAAKAAKAARKAEAYPEDPEAQKKAADAHRSAADAAMATQQLQGEDAKPKQLRGSFASLGSSTIYRWEVVDLKTLADEHKTFNTKTIDAAIKGEKAMAKAQGREFNLQLLAGVRIWPEERGISR